MTPKERAEELDRLRDCPELDRLYDDIRTEVAKDLHEFRCVRTDLSMVRQPANFEKAFKGIIPP